MLKKLIVLLPLLAIPSFAQSAAVKWNIAATTPPMVMAFFQATGHSVVLTITPSSDAAANPSMTYNIYRTPVASSSGCSVSPTAPKVATAISALTFTDSNVLVGQSYCYAATASLNGGESAFSPTAGATIPIAAPGISAAAK